MTAAVVPGLAADLAAEVAELTGILDGVPEAWWRRPTPAPGWSVHDQVAHLAHFDWVTWQAISHPEEFVRLRDEMPDLQAYVDSIGPANASRDGRDMLRWWSEQEALLRAAALRAPEGIRVPWFGPSMSVASKLSARIMETWAHGQDIVDALGRHRNPTDRLRHVARIGVLAFPNSFHARGLDVPTATVHIALSSPSGGATWEWGEAHAEDSVVGPAEDFCLVVTQRRHLDDTALEVTGRVATAWMAVAQAFAGPPGPGREPGQFAGTTHG